MSLALTYGAIELGNGPLSYTIQAQTDGHGYQAVLSTGKPFATVREAAGHSYRFRVEATDSFGDTSAWAVGSMVRLDVLHDTSPAIVYSGTWSTTKAGSAYGGTTTSSSDFDSSLSVTFSASDVALVMPLQPGGGFAQLFVDNQSQPALNLSAATLQPRQVVFEMAFGFVGSHTIRLVPSGNGPISLDAIVVLH